MKIGSFEAKSVAPASGPTAGERKAGAASAANGAAATVEASAQVQISPQGSLMVQVADDPAFDAAKVERIAAAIRDGKFQVNAEAIADKLIVNAEELLGRKSS